MARLARLPAHDSIPHGGATAHRHVPRLRTRFYAFLSYSHKDKELADWLHRELERFRVPHALAGKLTANGVVPRRLVPIFRDQQDLSAGGDLAEEIKAALAASQFLVVLCSPTAAISRWTNAEIESFKRTRPEGCVLAAVADGEPFATEMPGREAEECFPPALRFKYDRRGHQTAKRAEPLAADFREGGEGRRTAFLKLVAGMLGVGLDELVQRETTRRHRQLAWLAAGSLAGMAVTSTLAITAIQARDAARDQRREAEGLVAFMLGDLKDKLEPIGRLDALDGVGSKVLAYYSKQNAAELSDAALLQRSRALSLMAEVANLRGDLAGAQRLYREAAQGTAETFRRKPTEPQRVFEHAQNVFWVGEIARQKGDIQAAESGMREYKRLALSMVSLEPDNMKWRMEEQSAEGDLGIILYDQRRFAEAETQLAQAMQTIEALATADPRNEDYQKSLLETLAWLSDAKMSQGKFGEATALRQKQIALLGTMLAQKPDTVYYRVRLARADQALGQLYSMQGQSDLAAENLRYAVTQADKAISVEPTNTQSLEFGFATRSALADHLVTTGNFAEAATQNNAACAIVSKLISHDSAVPLWRAGLRDCWTMRSRLSLKSGASANALAAAQKAVAIAKTVKTRDRGADSFALAEAYRLLGDGQRSLGKESTAQIAWRSALASLPSDIGERPRELNEHAIILQRLGRGTGARRLASRLASMGYRQAGAST